jgi:hypothetical protein
MLELRGQPFLDKQTLVGACLKLPLALDPLRLQAEVSALPPSVWGTTDGRVGVHRVTESVFLRGHAPAEGDLPVTERPPLAHLPYVREIIEKLIPAVAMRCLLALLPPGGRIASHIDRAPYFSQTIRLHMPVVSNENAVMFCAGYKYRMHPGEIWALNNCAPHSVWNGDTDLARIHLICDFLLSEDLSALLRNGQRDLGELEHAAVNPVAI